MNKIITLCILSVLMTGLTNSTKAQWVTIPDPNFVNFLQTNFGTCMNGNQMDTTCTLITSTSLLNCYNKNISDITGIEYFDNLDTLYLGNNNLTSLVVLPPSLTHLYCGNNDLTSLPNIPPGAVSIECRSNIITSIGSLPNSLIFLDCSYNQLVSLPTLPSNLSDLRVTGNNLTSLPTLPASLNYLTAGENQLISLPILPSALIQLHVNDNQLLTLPSLPVGLNFLNANNNPDIVFPTLPSQIDTLHVLNTGLTALPSPLPSTITSLSFGNPGFIVSPVLPAGLLQLVIYETDLTVLPSFPSTLEVIDLRLNHLITSVPPLPAGLFLFSSIDNDGLQTLPPIPSTVRRLYATLGSFTSIPELPDTLEYCYFDDNPQLTCLPKLNKIGSLHFQNTAINCIPNYGSVTTSSPPLSAFPICDIFNSNACDFYLNIAGKVYADNNSNCNDDPGESVSNSVKVNLYQAGNLIQQNVSLPSGQYDFEVPLGTYTYSVDTTNMPFEVLCPPSGEHQSILTSLDSVDLNMDFGLQCKIQDDLGIHAIVQDSGIFRPTQTTLLNVIAGDIAQIYNLNCAAGTSGTVTVFFAGPVQYAGNFPGSEIPVVTPNSLTYNIADFGAIDIYSAFKFYMTTDTNTLGIPDVCFTVNVTLPAGDLNPSNNTYTHCFAIWNSYDPNFKEANPTNFIANTAEWLTYTIHFQNTGNAPALNIVISDTLDANLQESTFTYLQSSHEVFTQVTGNVIKFNFPNINLPDSTNDEPNSHGYVQYKVKIDQGLNVGQTIQNTAAIYFDFNPPVITNTTSTLIVAPTSVTSPIVSTWSVYPVPSSESFVITHPSLESMDLTITDIAGKEVSQLTNYKPGMPVNVVSWADGIYLIKITSGSAHETLKFIKAK